MPTIKLTLSYDGTDYAGWQFQPGQKTLQGTLQQTLEKITGEPIRVVGSGRTDAGVHAIGQVVSVETASHLTPDVLQKALNAELPRDMIVTSAMEAAPDFHAIRNARRKRYRYSIDDGPLPDVFERRYVWHCRSRLDVPAMQRAAQALCGTHDFASFESHGSERQSSVRTIFEIDVCRGESRRANCVTVDVEADGFLYNMVRTIVGSLVEIGRAARREPWLVEVLNAADRRAAGRTAPPHGLCLIKVDYDE